MKSSVSGGRGGCVCIWRWEKREGKYATTHHKKQLDAYLRRGINTVIQRFKDEKSPASVHSVPLIKIHFGLSGIVVFQIFS